MIHVSSVFVVVLDCESLHRNSCGHVHGRACIYPPFCVALHMDFRTLLVPMSAPWHADSAHTRVHSVSADEHHRDDDISLGGHERGCLNGAPLRDEV